MVPPDRENVTPKWNLQVVDLAVVGVVDFRGIQPEGRLRVTNHAQKQAGMLIETEIGGGPIFVDAIQHLDFTADNDFRIFDA